jgi:hypothetical protein
MPASSSSTHHTREKREFKLTLVRRLVLLNGVNDWSTEPGAVSKESVNPGRNEFTEFFGVASLLGQEEQFWPQRPRMDD